MKTYFINWISIYSCFDFFHVIATTDSTAVNADGDGFSQFEFIIARKYITETNAVNFFRLDQFLLLLMNGRRRRIGWWKNKILKKLQASLSKTVKLCSEMLFNTFPKKIYTNRRRF